MDAEKFKTYAWHIGLSIGIRRDILYSVQYTVQKPENFGSVWVQSHIYD